MAKKLTVCCKEYWIEKGFSETIATYKSRSFNKRCKEYWTERGYTDEEAKFHTRAQQKCCKEYWIKGGSSEKEAEYKKKTSRVQFKEYWLERGFSEEEAKEKVKKFQSNAGKRAVEKMKKLKKDNYKGWAEKQNTHIEYWKKKGYSQEEAESKLFERQAFTLEKCKKKYGNKKGYEFWRKRQEKMAKNSTKQTT